MITAQKPPQAIHHLEWFIQPNEDSPLPETMPNELQASMPGSSLVLREWTKYTLYIGGAEALWVGNRLIQFSPALGYFNLEFQNQLGPTLLTPVFQEGQGDSMQVEVIAGKFASVGESLQFMNRIVEQLSARISTLPFVVRADTARQIVRQHRDPNVFFAFQFLRHHGDDLIRALQIIAADPHRKLDEVVETLRIHQVRKLDAEAIHSLITGPRAESASIPTSSDPLRRLQPMGIRQRRPEETWETAENRFLVAICLRLRTLLAAIESASWFQNQAMETDCSRQRRLARTIQMLLQSDRFSHIPASLRLPAHSRVLQYRSGYREVMLFWNGLSQIHHPALARLDRAIDLRDVPTLYEYWLFFELTEAIKDWCGISPTYPDVMDPYESDGSLSAVFEGLGTLRAHANCTAYTRISLTPDFLWKRVDGRIVALDAKFAMTSVGELETDGENVPGSKATSRDITKMHAYRDAIAGVESAWVLFPGTIGRFWGADERDQSVAGLREILPRVIAGELSGIGAIPIKPVGVK